MARERKGREEGESMIIYAVFRVTTLNHGRHPGRRDFSIGQGYDAYSGTRIQPDIT